MAGENLERVRLGFERFNRGELDELLAEVGPDVEWHVLDQLPDAQVYTGPDAIRRFWEAWRDMFEDFRVEVGDLLEAGDHVVAMISVRGRGRESGIAVDTPQFPQVWTFRDGELVRVAMYQSREEALRAVGLEDAV
jgi:ketosteroid isomerase-like protein